jgi:hypothetical protein
MAALPAHQPSLYHCAACGDLLEGEYFTLIGRPDRFCSRCITTRPRCAACGSPLGAQHWRLHDGRLHCPACHATAIYNPDEALRIYNETVAGVIRQLGLTLNVGVAFRMVDAPTLERIRAEGGSSAPEGQSTLGLYKRQGHLRTIYMLYGLPRLTFRITVAHEYAHAWQGERCPLLNDEDLREGFAEWVAYHHLHWLGCTLAAERMITTAHPYRDVLDRMVELECRLGISGVIAFIKQAE